LPRVQFGNQALGPGWNFGPCSSSFGPNVGFKLGQGRGRKEQTFTGPGQAFNGST
ncbi:hypothetical protein AMTR_s00062p00123340, partial [Amborella trichopoda]